MEEMFEYILIYQYHDTYIDTFGNLGLLRIALANLKETYKNDKDFKYTIYCGKNVTDLINELEDRNAKDKR